MATALFSSISHLTLVLSVALLLGLFACATDVEIEREIVDEPISLDVSAVELRFDYDANDVGADLKYKDKVVGLTGYVSDIHSKDLEGASVTLKTDNMVEEVRCHFTEAHVNEVAGLRKGDWVKFRGQVEGKGLTDIFDISVRACSLLEHRPSSTMLSGTRPAVSHTIRATATPTAMIQSTTASTLEIGASILQTAKLEPKTAPTQSVTIASQTPARSLILEATPTLRPSLTPIPTPTPVPPGLRLSNPVEAGEVLKGSGGLEIVVRGIVEDAWPLVRAENRFNDPPVEGRRFYMISVEVAYTIGDGAVDVLESDFKLVGDNRFVYEPYNDSCGVIPDELSGEVYVGGKIGGNICFQISSDDSGLILIHQPGFSFGEGDRRFLHLDPLRLGSPLELTLIPAKTTNDAAMALPPGMALENPVAAGEVLRGSSGLEIVVRGIVEDAWPLVRAENRFNDPPVEGRRFYMISVEVAYTIGDGAVDVLESDFKLVGDNRFVYEPYNDSCGVIPDELSGEVYVGGKIGGNICFQISSDDSGLILIHQPGFSFGEGDRRFLHLDPLRLGSPLELTLIPAKTTNDAAMALPPGMALENPVEAGEVLRGSSGLEIVVRGIVEDAWPLVRAENRFNDPPVEGRRFYMISVEVAYTIGDGAVDVSESDFKLVGDNRFVYEPYSDSCGVIPDELSGEVYVGGKIGGNICFQISSDDSGLILIHQPGFSFGEGDRRFLHLDPLRLGSPLELTLIPAKTTNDAAMALPPGMALENPVEAGEVLRGSSGLEIVVRGIVEDAWPLVRAENRFNDPPVEGRRFYMISVEVAYTIGDGAVDVSESDFKLVGDNRFVYEPYSDSCGVIPDELSGEVYVGGKIGGNICFQISSDDSGLILIHQPGFSFGEGDRRFLHLV